MNMPMSQFESTELLIYKYSTCPVAQWNSADLWFEGSLVWIQVDILLLFSFSLQFFIYIMTKYNLEWAFNKTFQHFFFAFFLDIFEYVQVSWICLYLGMVPHVVSDALSMGSIVKRKCLLLDKIPLDRIYFFVSGDQDIAAFVNFHW